MATRQDSSFRYFPSDIDLYPAVARNIRKSNIGITISCYYSYYYFNYLNLGGLELIEVVLKTAIPSLLKTLKVIRAID
jgi:hypothetical protein